MPTGESRAFTSQVTLEKAIVAGFEGLPRRGGQLGEDQMVKPCEQLMLGFPEKEVDDNGSHTAAPSFPPGSFQGGLPRPRNIRGSMTGLLPMGTPCHSVGLSL